VRGWQGGVDHAEEGEAGEFVDGGDGRLFELEVAGEVPKYVAL